MSKNASAVRYAELDHEIEHARVHVVLDLDGGDRQDVATGILLLDQLLRKLASFGQLDLGISAESDDVCDQHHLVEAVGFALGRAIRETMKGGEAIVRQASCYGVSDDALVLAAVDIGSRGQLFGDLPFQAKELSGLSLQNIPEFLRALAYRADIAIHVQVQAFQNDHHLCEAVFIALGKALHAATRVVERRTNSR